MRRTAREYVQLDAARLSLRLGAVDAPARRVSGAHPPTGSENPVVLGADRVHVELTSAFTTEGRHFILEGGNVLTLRRRDGETVVLVGHNARTSADAIDELAYRLLRDDGRHLRGRVAAVIVVDMPEAGVGHDGAPHLDTRLWRRAGRARDRRRPGSLVSEACGGDAGALLRLPPRAGDTREEDPQAPRTHSESLAGPAPHAPVVAAAA